MHHEGVESKHSRRRIATQSFTKTQRHQQNTPKRPVGPYALPGAKCMMIAAVRAAAENAIRVHMCIIFIAGKHPPSSPCTKAKTA